MREKEREGVREEERVRVGVGEREGERGLVSEALKKKFGGRSA